MAETNIITNPLAEALSTHGRHINDLVIKTDHIDSVLNAALYFYSDPSQVNGLISVARDALSTVNDILNDLDSSACLIEDMAKEVTYG